jgi:predicted TIM-barrel fold metal-dependent hydrolase
VPVSARELIAQLDSAGTDRAVVLSVAYWFGAPRFHLPDEYAKVRAENDWTDRQVAEYPKRLVWFCSVSPIKDYAIAEIERCVRELHPRGLKLHFASSGVDVTNPDHLARVRRVFETANRLRLPIVVHARTGNRGPYTAEHARIIISQLLPAAPDVPVTIAHLWGGGDFADSALAVYADAVAAKDPRTKNLWFDVTDIMSAISDSPANMATVVRRIREIGLNRMLWGSDMSPPNPGPREMWMDFHHLPLTEHEFTTIAGNVAPYLR